MFAVVKIGGKQYRVAADDKITIMSHPGEVGDQISFEDVLFVGNGESFQFGAKAKVTAEIVAQARGPKTISFKKRRRQNSKRKRGHRQDLTIVKIVGVT